MIISKDTYIDIIRTIKPDPPETGGILGGKNNIVTEFFPDKGIPSQKMCSYYPNVYLLNQTIKRWQLRNVEFMGIFHLHFWGVDTLSEGDEKYIKRIMKYMPEDIDNLYFPIIVVPQYEMVCYVAKRISGECYISRDELCIQENDNE